MFKKTIFCALLTSHFIYGQSLPLDFENNQDNFNGFLYEKNNSDDFKRKFIEIYEMSIKDNDKKVKIFFIILF